ncbi:D-2-hydroxyglutaric acid dehydrogenase [Carabus blaptoides fortunei]
MSSILLRNSTLLARSITRGGPLIPLCRGLATSTDGLPELTKDRYPHVHRGDYAELAECHVRHFTNILGDTRVLTDTTDVQGYNVDWIKNVRGYSRCVLKPRTTEEVSTILAYCNNERLAVCPQGGNTGLVGGSVPVFDEIVLSTALMNQIITLDATSGILVCQAGCVLETLETYLDERDLIMPLDLGAKGSCHIGGNVSTNAGGLRLLRYGNLHGNVLGVEAVKANGDIVDCLNSLKKDNTGYHLKHLFIGSEGTLGVVTKVAIQCPIKPKAVSLAFLALESFDNILETYKRAKNRLGEVLSSCEMADALSMDCVSGNLKVKNPLGEYPFYMLIETSGSNGNHDEEKLNQFLEEVMTDGIVLDGTMTNEPGRMKHIWQLRERIAEGLLHDGYVLKYDISFPIEKFYSIVPEIAARLGDDAKRCCGYGHIGDGNLHLNVSLKEYDAEIMKKIEPFVYEYTSRLKGSISAEHGIGFKKPNYMHYSKSETAIGLMKDIKHMMDPNGILNPYKVLPK